MMKSKTYSGFGELAKARFGIPENRPAYHREELPSIIQQYIDNGLIKMLGDGSFWSAESAKTPVRLGHISKLQKLANYLKRHPESYEWKNR